MSYTSVPNHLTDENRAILEKNVRSTTTEQQIVLRSRIVLLAADGLGTNDIAREFNIRPGTLSKWRVRFTKN